MVSEFIEELHGDCRIGIDAITSLASEPKDTIFLVPHVDLSISIITITISTSTHASLGFGWFQRIQLFFSKLLSAAVKDSYNVGAFLFGEIVSQLMLQWV